MPPLPPVTFDKKSFAEPSGIADFNQQWSYIIGAVNGLLGYTGPSKFKNSLDVTGNRVQNVADPIHSGDAVSKSYADANYGSKAIQPNIEILGKQILQSTRRLNDPTQRETYSSFLNALMSTAPSTNSSTVNFGSPSGGTISIAISAGIFSQLDGGSTPYTALNDTVTLPGVGNNFYYYYLPKNSAVLQRDGPYGRDSWLNRLNSNRDGKMIIAVAGVTTSGSLPNSSAAGATDPLATGGNHIFGRL